MYLVTHPYTHHTGVQIQIWQTFKIKNNLHIFLAYSFHLLSSKSCRHFNEDLKVNGIPEVWFGSTWFLIWNSEFITLCWRLQPSIFTSGWPIWMDGPFFSLNSFFLETGPSYLSQGHIVFPYTIRVGACSRDRSEGQASDITWIWQIYLKDIYFRGMLLRWVLSSWFLSEGLLEDFQVLFHSKWTLNGKKITCSVSLNTANTN